MTQVDFIGKACSDLTELCFVAKNVRDINLAPIEEAEWRKIVNPSFMVDSYGTPEMLGSGF